MTRYASALQKTAFWLGFASNGWALVLVAPGEHRAVAEELARRVPGRPIIELNEKTDANWFVPIVQAETSQPAGAIVYLQPDLDLPGRIRVLQMLNGQRDRTSRFGTWVLIATVIELENQLRRFAGDLSSIFSVERVRFEPRALTDVEVAAARAALHAHYQRRFGKLDLRGFIRAEHEDSAFAVEDLFEPMAARGPTTTRDPAGEGQVQVSEADRPLVEHLTRPRDRPVLLVGAPGSGKTFFLRWCALQASREPSFLGIERAVPIFIPLAAINAVPASPELEEFIAEALLTDGLAIAHALASEADAGRVVFLLDGLDEIGFRRSEAIRGIAALATRHPAVRVIVTSRPTGLTGLTFEADRLELAPLADDAIRSLLTRWCELYEMQRAGSAAGPKGRAEGTALAEQVVASPTLHELARSPLLATIIAIVHRAGVRLPEHRVELYDHMVKILVERWNQLRTLESAYDPPIRVQDAIRLLGPVALSLIETGIDTAVDEVTLRSRIEHQLAAGTVKSIHGTDAAVAMFRDTLGVLVEQAPGVYGFLHKTLAEFLAAHEAVRTRRLEKLIAAPESCSSGKWREVILLGLGIVGNLQADDDRLRDAVGAVLATVGTTRARPASSVADLLGGIIADDPALSRQDAARLVDELIPFWWPGGLIDHRIAERLARGSWTGLVRERLDPVVKRGVVLPREGALHAFVTEVLLEVFGYSSDLLLCAQMVALATSSDPARYELRIGSSFRESFEADADGAIRIPVPSRLVAALLRHGAGALVTVTFDDEDIEVALEEGVLVARGGMQRVKQVTVSVQTHPVSLELLPAILAAWRELASVDANGPQPPASVEEAMAIYGPPPDPPPPAAST